MQFDQYNSNAQGAESPTVSAMVQQVREAYLKSGTAAAYGQLSELGHRVQSNSAVESARYSHVLNELQRQGILPQITEYARQRIDQGQSGSETQPSQPRQRYSESQQPINQQPAAYAQRQREAEVHPTANNTVPPTREQIHAAPSAANAQIDNRNPDKQLIQDYITVSLRARTGQLDQTGRTWLDSTWKYLQQKESPEELEKTRNYIQSQFQHPQTAPEINTRATQRQSDVQQPYEIDPGVSSYRDIRGEIMQGLKIAGVTNPTDAQGLAIYNIGYRESRWRAYPPKEGSSKGPMQMEMGTFRDNFVPGYNNVRAIPDSVAAATVYIARRYGDGTPGSGLIYIGNRFRGY